MTRFGPIILSFLKEVFKLVINNNHFYHVIYLLSIS
jgi:hypothetical protein